MPLKIRVKPEGKIVAGGAVLKNVGNRPAELLVLSDSPVLRDDYLMNVERKDESDAATVYFLLQMIYLFKGKGQPLDSLVIDTIKNFSTLYPQLAVVVDEIIGHLEAGETFKALRLGQSLLQKESQKIDTLSGFGAGSGAGFGTDPASAGSSGQDPVPVLALSGGSHE